MMNRKAMKVFHPKVYFYENVKQINSAVFSVQAAAFVSEREVMVLREFTSVDISEAAHDASMRKVSISFN